MFPIADPFTIRLIGVAVKETRRHYESALLEAEIEVRVTCLAWSGRTRNPDTRHSQDLQPHKKQSQQGTEVGPPTDALPSRPHTGMHELSLGCGKCELHETHAPAARSRTKLRDITTDRARSSQSLKRTDATTTLNT